MGVGRDCLLGNFPSTFWLSLATEGFRLLGGSLHWMGCIGAFSSFVAPNSQEPLVVIMLVIMFARDLHLMPRKDYLGMTMTREQAQHQLV